MWTLTVLEWSTVIVVTQMTCIGPRNKNESCNTSARLGEGRTGGEKNGGREGGRGEEEGQWWWSISQWRFVQQVLTGQQTCNLPHWHVEAVVIRKSMSANHNRGDEGRSCNHWAVYKTWSISAVKKMTPQAIKKQQPHIHSALTASNSTNIHSNYASYSHTHTHPPPQKIMPGNVTHDLITFKPKCRGHLLQHTRDAPAPASTRPLWNLNRGREHNRQHLGCRQDSSSSSWDKLSRRFKEPGTKCLPHSMIMSASCRHRTPVVVLC